jgi:aminoglycoside phosphotransferase (APT) family kinase protein
MSQQKMHADEVETSSALVGRLLAAQFPRWAHLPVRAVPSAGTDNALYRLGEEMAVRMPRIGRAVAQVEKEQQWLPRLAPHLPLAIPIPLAHGEPGEGYPWRWSVYRWLEGETATAERLGDLRQAATDLAQFVSALHGIDTTGGPLFGEHNFYRGEPLARRDAPVREALASLRGEIDVEAAASAWEAALQAPAWQGAPVWIHGDLQAGNLLAVAGRLQAVIDFGGLGLGDPACDLMPAWNLFDAEARETYRSALQADEAAWARGRGWALSMALIALPYYLHTNPTIVRNSRHVIAAILAERGSADP